jgi:hypothetical protein
MLQPLDKKYSDMLVQEMTSEIWELIKSDDELFTYSMAKRS